MTKIYIDNWGEESELVDQTDWSNWPLWARWEAKYDWQDGEDFIEQDVIVWRENIIVNQNARKPEMPAKWVKVGERMVIAHIRQWGGDAADWVYMVVIHSDGDQPLLRDQKIKRRVANIRRNGVRRWPREGRAAVGHQNDDFDRSPDIPANVRRAVESRTHRLGVQHSKFLGEKSPHSGDGSSPS